MERELRLECLKLAQSLGQPDAESTVEAAQLLYEYVNLGVKSVETQGKK